MLYIRCSALYTPTRQFNDAAIIIDRAKILAIGDASRLSVPAGADLLDVPHLRAVPGYMDWQLNGGFGMDFTETPATIWDVAARLPEHGVTAFLPTIITAPLETYSAAIEIMRAGPPSGFRGAWPLGLHFEGPYLNPGKKGAHNSLHLRTPSLAETSTWSRKNGVWLVTLAPELPGASVLIQELTRKAVVVSAGHSLATYQEAIQAFESGVSCATHLFNAMPPLDHRMPGLAAACLHSPNVAVGLIPDGIHVHSAMVAMAWKLKGSRRTTIVTDAMAALGMSPGKYILGDYQVTVNDVSARLDGGTLAGSIVRMDQAVRNFAAFTGCSFSQAVTSATLSVASMLRVTRKGRLRPGSDADLVLLDDQASPVVTFVRGEMVFSRL